MDQRAIPDGADSGALENIERRGETAARHSRQGESSFSTTLPCLRLKPIQQRLHPGFSTSNRPRPGNTGLLPGFMSV